MNNPQDKADKQSRRKFTRLFAATIVGVPFTSSLIGCNRSPQSPNTSTPNPASESALAKARRPLLVKSDPDRLKSRPGQTGHRLAIIESDDKIKKEQPTNELLDKTVGISLIYVKKTGNEKPERLFHPRLESGKALPAKVTVYSIDQNGKEVIVLSLEAVKQSVGMFTCDLSITVVDNFKLADYQGGGNLDYKYEVIAEKINQPYISRVHVFWGEAADIEHLPPYERTFNRGEFDCLNIELDKKFCEERYCNCDKA